MANYRISELDFDGIKNNLKQFLTNYRDKDNNLVFKDYDFDASSLSILLDLLSYNTTDIIMRILPIWLRMRCF